MAEKEYIEREAAIEKLNKLCDRVCQYSKAQRKYMCGACPLGDAFTVIEAVPAADVRPVVLCLHCKNWDTSWAPNCGKEYGHFCPMVGNVTRADWYCSDGEKREES